ncbi:MAG: hypothetical protein EZS28_002742 [Streblomastix strix]|uniref:Uncharacterized protein n=1 Tax=Streblomastix strix TaxID=222440 RepID=A0A5J4X505_9EUKA|nr:MAG: hypothetical protein EZS28_002742 [Streblomastix strix]
METKKRTVRKVQCKVAEVHRLLAKADVKKLKSPIEKALALKYRYKQTNSVLIKPGIVYGKALRTAVHRQISKQKLRSKGRNLVIGQDFKDGMVEWLSKRGQGTILISQLNLESPHGKFQQHNVLQKHCSKQRTQIQQPLPSLRAHLSRATMLLSYQAFLKQFLIHNLLQNKFTNVATFQNLSQQKKCT